MWRLSIWKPANCTCLWIDLKGHIGSKKDIDSGLNIDRLSRPYDLNDARKLTITICTSQQSRSEPPSTQKERDGRGVGEGKLCYQSWASKTIRDISWVICDPAFFILQRAAVYRGGFEDRGEMESDFSDKCWHRACLILESEKILIRCVFENSSDDLRSTNWLVARFLPSQA